MPKPMNMSTLSAVLMIVPGLLVGCGGGGDGASDPCLGSFSGGAVDASGACTACGDASTQNAIDGSRQTYASAYQVSGTYTVHAFAKTGTVFQGGQFAGALMRIPVSYTGATWTFNTLLDGVPVESRTPANEFGDDPNIPSGTDAYYGFMTTQDFDEVEVILNGGTSNAADPSSESVRFYEMCSDH